MTVSDRSHRSHEVPMKPWGFHGNIWKSSQRNRRHELILGVDLLVGDLCAPSLSMTSPFLEIHWDKPPSFRHMQHLLSYPIDINYNSHYYRLIPIHIHQ